MGQDLGDGLGLGEERDEGERFLSGRGTRERRDARRSGLRDRDSGGGRGSGRSGCRPGGDDPFFTTKKIGFGLRLCTVMGVVRESDGLIRAEKTPGGGACFRIFLPARLRCEETREEASPAGVPEAREEKTVLVVDGEPEVRRVLVAALNRFGFTAMGARDGKEARATVRTHSGAIDLFLIDAGLPDASGPELTEDLTTTGPGSRVILISGSSREEIIFAPSHAQAFGFLEKPFPIEELLDRAWGALRPAEEPGSEGRG